MVGEREQETLLSDKKNSFGVRSGSLCFVFAAAAAAISSLPFVFFAGIFPSSTCNLSCLHTQKKEKKKTSSSLLSHLESPICVGRLPLFSPATENERVRACVRERKREGQTNVSLPSFPLGASLGLIYDGLANDAWGEKERERGKEKTGGNNRNQTRETITAPAFSFFLFSLISSGSTPTGVITREKVLAKRSRITA